MLMITRYDPQSPAALGVTLRGDLDDRGATELHRRMLSLLTLDRPLHVHLDLENVTFLGCSGVRTLSWLDACVRLRGGTLTLVRPSPPVTRLLRLLRSERRSLIGGDDRARGGGRIIRLGPLRVDHQSSPN